MWRARVFSLVRVKTQSFFNQFVPDIRVHSEYKVGFMALKNSLEFNKTWWPEHNKIFWNSFTFHEVYEWVILGILVTYQNHGCGVKLIQQKHFWFQVYKWNIKQTTCWKCFTGFTRIGPIARERKLLKVSYWGNFGEKCGSRQSASWHLPGLPIPGPLSQVQDPGYQCNAGPGQGLVVGGTMMGTWALVTHPEWITANTSKYLTWSMGPVFPFRAPHGNRSQTSSLFHTIKSWRNEAHSPVFKLKHFPQ